MNKELEQIKTIAIFTFVYAGVSALFAFFPVIHLSIGISMLNGSLFGGSAPSDTEFPFNMFALMFTIIPAIMILAGLTYAIALAISGNFLLKKRHYLFCMIMAGISCAFAPFGTVLGIFTILLLQRPSVKELFNYGIPASGKEKPVP
jgi:hypothetical protein